MEKRIFLCCFCGVKIQSSRNNLERHEKQHAPHVSRIQCAAKKCDSDFCNKSYYRSHWIQKHSDTTMPDFLIQTLKVKKQRKPYTRMSTTAVKGDEESRNSTKHSNIEKIEKSYDFLNVEIGHTENLNMENIIEDWLIRNPFYGYLNDLGA